MFIFRSLARAFLLQRLMQRGQRRRSGRYGRRGRRGRTGFWGPMPYYSGRTRRGTRVHVSGCCLPIPLGMLLATALGARSLVRRG